MTWDDLRAAAADLEAAVFQMLVALDPARAQADALAAALRARAPADVAGVVEAVARTLAHVAAGEVEPHHAQWRLAAALDTVRQALDHLAGGAPYPPVALAGARYELETLLPLPDGRPALAPGADVVPAASLVRRPT